MIKLIKNLIMKNPCINKKDGEVAVLVVEVNRSVCQSEIKENDHDAWQISFVYATPKSEKKAEL